MPLKNLPPDARPREKLLARRPAALSDVELLALLLRTGIQDKGVLQMVHEQLQIPTAETSGFGGIAGMLNATSDDLKALKAWALPNVPKSSLCSRWKNCFAIRSRSLVLLY